MSIPSNNPFDAAFAKLERPQFAEESKLTQQRRWEHRIVAKTLEHFGRPQLAKPIMDEMERSHDYRALSFAGLKSMISAFPAWLVCRKVPRVHQLTVEDCVKKFPKTNLFKAFEEAESIVPDRHQGMPYGLVFEWLHVWPTAIIHNFYHATQNGGTTILHYSAKTKERVAVQSFDAFLDSLPGFPEDQA